MDKADFRADFNLNSVLDWERIATQELGNKNPWEKLAKSKLSITIKPYYDKADSIEREKLRFSTTANWLNVPKVVVDDDHTANQEALTHLITGADGIWFEILQPANAKKLLHNIELTACALYFSSKSNSQLNLITDYIESKSKGQKISGAFFAEGSQNFISPIKDKNNFRWHGIIVKQNESIVDEIVDSLLTTVDSIEGLMKKNFSAEEAFRSLAYSVTVDTDFFISIAKIRALKNLWHTLQDAYEIKNPIPVFVHAYSSRWINENFQPHGNMLKQTTAAMACAMAGCDAITVEPENAGNSTMLRIARNVSPVLREESHLTKVNDPLAGSFYIEALTHQIADAAWQKFQQQ